MTAFNKTLLRYGNYIYQQARCWRSSRYFCPNCGYPLTKARTSDIYHCSMALGQDCIYGLHKDWVRNNPKLMKK